MDFYFWDDKEERLKAISDVARDFPPHVFSTGPVTSMSLDAARKIVKINCAVPNSEQGVDSHGSGGIVALSEVVKKVKRHLDRTKQSGQLRTMKAKAGGAILAIEEDGLNIDPRFFPGIEVDLARGKVETKQGAARRRLTFCLPVEEFDPRLCSHHLLLWAQQSALPSLGMVMEVSWTYHTNQSV